MPARAGDDLAVRSLEQAAAAYIAAGRGDSGAKCRRHGVARFLASFETLTAWASTPAPDRIGLRSDLVSFAAFAAVHTRTPLDPEYVVTSGCRWGKYHAKAHPTQAAEFLSQATSLGFCDREVDRMWAHLSRIATIAGVAPHELTSAQYATARVLFHDTVIAVRGGRPKTLSTPLFGLDAVMFHRGQAPRPDLRRRWTGRPVAEVDWAEITAHAPTLTVTMRRYLDQMALSLRPSSVACLETSLRQLAGMLVRDFPEVTAVADIGREHVEAYKTWLAARPGYRNATTLSKTTLGMRLGHLHAFFARITEWGYQDAPARIPVYTTDRPRLDKPLPKFLDDAQAAAFINAARDLPDPLERLMVLLLARTGMRRGELLGLTIDAVARIGTGYWLRTPVGKLHTDRYIPLHPQLKDLIDDWVADRANWQASTLLLTDRGRPIPPTRVDKAVQKAATAAGVGHVHPHQLRHTLATQAINRGMSLEAIAALLGHHDLSMTMVYARIADRTVADEYFAVTKKVESLYAAGQPVTLPAAAAGPAMRALRAEATKRLLGNGYCARPVELDCRYETICESCSMFFTTIEHRPTIQAQREDADAKGQTGRRDVYDNLLRRLDDTPA
jgi:integrase